MDNLKLFSSRWELYQINSKIREIKDGFNDSTTGEILEADWINLQLTNQNRNDILLDLACSVKESEALILAHENIIEDHKAVIAREQGYITKVKEFLAAQLEDSEKLSDLRIQKLALQKNPPRVVVDCPIEQLPENYITRKFSGKADFNTINQLKKICNQSLELIVEPNKKELATALKDGIQVEGVRLEQGRSLVIK